MIEEEAATNTPRTAADLLRGVREQVADIDPAAEAINTLLHRVMWRYTKAHMQSTREDLSEGQLVGEDRLHEDFLAQVTIVHVWSAVSHFGACAGASFRNYGMPPHSRCKRKFQRAAGQCRDMNI
ncbi:unnamed protein product [Ectocarpus sp. CCAP 1310/34]|nr:unnamed protein product [Ectocarpus sp. CCAP 1310/34]